MAMNVRLRPETDRILAELAEVEGVSKNQIVETAILEHADRTNHKAKVRAAFEKVRTRDAEALDLLSR